MTDQNKVEVPLDLVDKTKVKAQEEKREEELVEKRDETPLLTAKDLKQELSGDYKQRIEETKVVTITFVYGERPDVVFSGFWNGRLVKNAQNALSRSYRHRRHKQVRSKAQDKNVTVQKED